MHNVTLVQAIEAHTKTMATDYLSALNAGSGLNVTQIVDALVDAERVPKQEKIDEAKDAATVKISALGSLKNELSVFQTNTTALDGQIGLALSSSTSNVTLSRTDSSLASEFSHTINVSSIATGQVLNFDNGGSGFHRQPAILVSTASRSNLALGRQVQHLPQRHILHLALDYWRHLTKRCQSAINNAAIGVTASIIEVSTGSYSLMIKSPDGVQNAMLLPHHYRALRLM